MGETLKVSEIFLSIQGEGTRVGRPCAFVRLAGCNLRCRWCDTPYARSGGEAMNLDDVLARVRSLGCPLVLVTGGEPLHQPDGPTLVRALCDEGHETLVETNGSLDISRLDERAVRIVDFKCPSSGVADANRRENVEHLTGRDEVKFVLADRRDYDFAGRAVCRYDLGGRCEVIFSCVHGRLAPAELAKWILADRLSVRLGVQLHRIIWPGRDRGV